MSAAIEPRRRSVFVPVLLLVAGVLLLFFNFDLLPAGAGWRLLEVSPLILVMLGFQIVIARSITGPAASAVALAVVGLVALFGVGYVALGPSIASGSYARFTSSSPLGGIDKGTLTIDAAAGRVSIFFADTGTNLYRAQISYAGEAPKFQYANGDLRLSSSNRIGIDWGRRPDQYSLTLNRSVPWTIAVNGAGTTTSLELAGGRLSGFTFNGVGSTADLALSAPIGAVPIDINGVSAKATITVPPDVQYRAEAVGLASQVVGSAASSGWATTTDRYDFKVEGLASQVEVRIR